MHSDEIVLYFEVSILFSESNSTHIRYAYDAIEFFGKKSLPPKLRLRTGNYEVLRFSVQRRFPRLTGTRDYKNKTP